MPRPRTVITVTALEDTAEKLLAVGAQLTEAALKLRQGGMTEALLPWTNAHWRAVDKLIEAGLPMLAATQTEVNAFNASANRSQTVIHWGFTRMDARRKFGYKCTFKRPRD